MDVIPKKNKTIIIKKKNEVKPVIKAEAEDFEQLFGDKFIYCGIHLKQKVLKQTENQERKQPFW